MSHRTRGSVHMAAAICAFFGLSGILVAAQARPASWWAMSTSFK